MASKAELLERVDALLPAIAARAGESEDNRRPHDKTIRELIDAEILQALVPRRFGGHELHLDTMADIVRRVSSACVSSGWITAFYIGHNWMVTKFSERAQKEVFAERPFALVPVQTSPTMEIKPVPGGHEITGRSSWGSGIMHADWVIVAGGLGRDDARVFMLPIEEVAVDDVWFMSGMAGTGSNDIVVEDAFVPEHRSISASDFFVGKSSVHENPLYSLPFIPFIYCEAVGVYSGGLDGATAAYERLVQNKVMSWTGDVLAEKPIAHLDLGDARSRAQAAGILFDRLVEDTIALTDGSEISLDVRVDLKLRAGYIADLCREAVNAMMARAGTRSFQKDAPLQRYFRDINALATHAFIDWQSCREIYGRHLLGLPPNHPLV
jgi:alkylation response protein AidB-like acyl-CoA dehydrogenase